MTYRRYRVAQWGTGFSGKVALQALIGHPDFDLVGVKVYSDAKAGRDAGELCGLGPTGVIATKNIDDIIAAKPDCVVYMPARYDLDDVCRLLESGINISTLLENFHDPESLDREVRQRIEAACRRGGASIYSAGPSPGFITESVPLVLTSMQRRLDRLRIEEFADMSDRGDSPEMFALLGFGGEPAAELVSRLEQLTALHFGASLRQLATAVSLPLDDVTSTATVATAKSPVQIGGRTFEAGTVAAWRIEVSGIRHGKPLLQMVPTWWITRDLEPAWDIPFERQGWRVRVDGDVPLDVTLQFTWPTEEERARSANGNVNRPVNAVPYVCQAPPGILSTFTLPQIIPTLS